MFKYGILIIGITMLVVFNAFATDQTDVVITRANSSVENNRPVTVYIDDIRIGTLMPGRKLETRVNNGSHTISAKITPKNNKDIMGDYYFTADDTKTLQLRIHIEEEGVLLLKKTVIYITELED